MMNVLWAMLLRRAGTEEDRDLLLALVEWPVDPEAERERWGTDAAAEAGQNAMMNFGSGPAAAPAGEG